MLNSIHEKQKSIIKGTALYAIGSFGSKILSFIIVPLYTFFIVPEELGFYDLLLTTVSLLMPLVSMQFTDATYKWCVDDRSGEKRYISLTYLVLGISSLLTFAMILGVGSSIIGVSNSLYLALMLLSQMWFWSLQRMLRIFFHQRKFVVSGLFQSLAFFILTLSLVCVLRLGVVGLCYSFIMSHVIGCVYILFSSNELLLFEKCFDGNTIKKMIFFSLPLIPSAMCWWIINSSDKYIILWFLGTAQNGIYAVSSKFPVIIQTINSVFYTSWQDVAIREKQGKDRDELFNATFEQYYRLSFGFALVIIPFTHMALSLFVSNAYSSSSKYMAFLFLGAVFQGFASFFGIIYLNENKTIGATVTSIVAAIINIIVDFALMKWLGLYAAGISTFVGFFVICAIRFSHTRKYVNLKINKPLFASLFILSLLSTIGNCFDNLTVEITSLFVGLIVCVIVNKSVLIKYGNKLIRSR